MWIKGQVNATEAENAYRQKEIPRRESAATQFKQVGRGNSPEVLLGRKRRWNETKITKETQRRQIRKQKFPNVSSHLYGSILAPEREGRVVMKDASSNLPILCNIYSVQAPYRLRMLFYYEIAKPLGKNDHLVSLER
jgi:hypothetical protein